MTDNDSEANWKHKSKVWRELEWFARRFDGAVSAGPNAYKALCPAHDGHYPSLSIRLRDDGCGVALKCHDGCPLDRVLEAAGLDQQDLNFPAYLCQQGGGISWSPYDSHQPTQEDADFRQTVYQDLLSALDLDVDDRKALRRRGLSDEAIDRNQYRTLFSPSRTHRFFKKYGSSLYKVPGFWETEKGPAVYPHTGVLLPVRDVRGRITALQIRPDEARFGDQWLGGEAGSGRAPHVPLGVTGPCPLVRTTEGVLKADVIMALDPEKVPTIGFSGGVLDAWADALSVLQKLGAKAVRLAFDADWRTKKEVSNDLLSNGDMLADDGYQVEVEVWDLTAGKGLDEVLLTKGRRDLVPFQELRPQIEAAAFQGYVGEKRRRSPF